MTRSTPNLRAATASLLAFSLCVVSGAATAAEPGTAKASGSLDARSLLASAAHAGGAGSTGWTQRRVVVEIDAYVGDDVVRGRRAEILERVAPGGGADVGDDEIATLTEFLGPADVQGTRVLEQWDPGQSAEAWLWSPSTRRTRRMAEEQGDESPWYGVEPSYRDAQLLDALPRLASEAASVRIVGEEEIDGADATVLEVELEDARALPGSRYRVWISNADRLVRRIDVLGGSDRDESDDRGESDDEADDRDEADDGGERSESDDGSEPTRRIVARSTEAIEGRPTATEVEVATPGTERRTVFRRSRVRYDTGLPTRTWTLANLSKGR